MSIRQHSEYRLWKNLIISSINSLKILALVTTALELTEKSRISASFLRVDVRDGSFLL